MWLIGTLMNWLDGSGAVIVTSPTPSGAPGIIPGLDRIDAERRSTERSMTAR
jgi:hypothetical protein